MSSKSDLTLLRDQRKEAIATCDFQKAKLIALHLRELSGRQEIGEVAHQTQQNQHDYDQVKEAVRSEGQRAHAAAVEEIYRIESDFQARLAVLHDLQAERIAAHAASLAAELELSAQRGVPDSMDMKRQARIVAELGEYERAESLMQESDSTRAAAIQSRQDELTEIYDRLLRQLDAKHGEEVRLNQEKKLQRIGEVKLRYAKVLDKLRKQLANSARKYVITRDLVEEETYFQELTGPEAEQEQPVRPPSRSALAPPRTAKTEKSPTARRTPTSPRSPRSPKLRSRFSPVGRPLPSS
jgi:hypothetical protein